MLCDGTAYSTLFQFSINYQNYFLFCPYHFKHRDFFILIVLNQDFRLMNKFSKSALIHVFSTSNLRASLAMFLLYWIEKHNSIIQSINQVSNKNCLLCLIYSARVTDLTTCYWYTVCCPAQELSFLSLKTKAENTKISLKIKLLRVVKISYSILL